MQKRQDQRGISDARELALSIVYDVTENGAYANLSLDKALRASRLAPNDKKLVTEIVNGSIRMIKHLDWVLNLFLQKPVEKQNPWLRNILRISTYQLIFMQRIPDYAAVNSAVDLSRKKTSRALSGVCNGVLRNIIRNLEKIDYPYASQLEYLSVYYSQPEWLTHMWLEEFGPELTEKMFVYLNQSARLSLRNNELRGSSDQLLQDLAKEGVTASASPLIPCSIRVETLDKSIEELSSYQQGRFYIQNEASMLAAAILDPQPGERVIDLCCGLGGKTSHFAEKMENQGNIEAIDIHAHKISLLEKNCQRLGISIVQAQARDILHVEVPNPAWDRVFLDAPCSGLGVLNRRSDSRWRKKPEEILELSKLQRALLQKSSEMVMPGGVLVYSTCTINPLENEAIINDFISANHDFTVENLADSIHFFPMDEGDLLNARRGFLTLLPGKYDTDGMFYARLRRSKPS